MKEYIVTFRTSVQITEDEFTVINPAMKVTDSTTIKEVADFYKKISPKTLLEVTLIELTPPPNETI